MSSGEGLRDADLYDRDFYTWTQRQSAMIRDGRLQDADLANIAEEIESLGRSQVAELRSRYTVLCLHLLKKIVQPERDSRSWTTTIVGQRLEIPSTSTRILDSGRNVSCCSARPTAPRASWLRRRPASRFA